MILDKAKMAHEFAMKLVGNPTTPLKDMNSIIKASWQYVDAMQAEADKRVVKLPDVFFDAKTNEEWQPDWSQAPDWAVAWAMDMSGECYWHSGSKEPKVDNHIFESSADGHTFEAPSFGYKGKWKESLRKRP